MSSFHALSRHAGLAAQFDAVAEVDASVVGVALAKRDPDVDIYEAIEFAVGASLDSGRVDAVATEVLSVIARYAHLFVYSRPDQTIFFQPEVGGAVVEYRRFGREAIRPLQCLLGHEMPSRSSDELWQYSFDVATAASLDEDFGQFRRVLEDYFDLVRSERRPFLDELVQSRFDRSDATIIADELRIYGPDEFQLCVEQCGLIKYWQHWYASQSALAALGLHAEP